MFAPQRPISLAISPSVPGLSLIVMRSETILLSRSSPRMMMEASTRESMLRSALEDPNTAPSKAFLIGKRGGKPGRAGPFGDGFLHARKRENGLLHSRLAHEDHIRDKFANNGQRVGAGLHGDAFRQGCASAFGDLAAQGRIGRGIGFDLDADDFHRRAERLRGGGDACDEAASSNGHDHAIEVRAILDELEPGCALACNNHRVVVRMDQRKAVLRDQPIRRR